MRRAFPWSTLGIDADSDEAAVRRAYATKLKAMDPDADHKGFERLREARDRALALARSRAAGVVEEQEPVDDWLDDEEDDAQWHAGSREYDEDDLPVADYSTDPVASPAPYGGIYVDVLRGNGHTEQTPVIALGGDAALSVPVPTADTGFATPPLGLAFSPVSAEPGASLADNQFPVEPPVLGNSTDISDTVTPSALTRTVDGNVATSQDAIYRLLLEADPQAWLTVDEEAVIHRHLDVILGDGRMHEIGFAADMENWLATVFARSTPRSHPFVQRIADHFGWRADAGNINQPHSIAWLADRALAFDFRDKVTQPSNKGYGAWIELTTPASAGAKRGRAKYVRELLTTIRSKHPVLESELDWHRVSLWDGGSTVSGGGYGSAAGRFGGWGLIAVIILFQLVMMVSRTAGTDYGPAATMERMKVERMAAFDDPVQRRAAIDGALRAVGGNALTYDIVEQRDLELLDDLDQRLDASNTEQRYISSARSDMKELLYRRVRGGTVNVRFAALADLRRAQSITLKRLAVVDPQLCHPILIRGPGEGPFPPSGSNRIDLSNDPYVAIRAASANIILETDTEENLDSRRTFRALISTLDDAARRASMTRAELERGFSGNSTDRDQCIALAAIIDASLALDSQREASVILRAL